MPTSVADAVGKWVSGYASYAQSAIAGPVTLAGPLVPAAVIGPDFLTSLDSSIRVMWMSAVWVGPGVTAITTVVPPVQPAILSLSSVLITSRDRDLALSRIAEALHTYTLSIVVTVTPATGTPFPTPLS